MKRGWSSTPGVFRVVAALLLIILLRIPAQAFQAGSDSQAAERDYASATGLLNRGLNEMAATEYRKFLTAHPDHEKASLARYGLGVALLRLQQFEEAERELARINTHDGFSFAAETLLIRGQCLLALNKPADAAKALAPILQQHADHAKAPEAAAMLAESLYRAGEHKSVREPCQLIASKWPQHPLRERADYFNGLAAMAVEDFTFAAEVFDAMQKRFPKGQFFDQIALLLGQCWHRAGNVDRALRQYESVVKQNRGDGVADALYGQATLLHGKGQSQQAGKSFDQFIERFPQHRAASSARLQRGRIHFDEKRYDQAIALFEQAATSGAAGDETAFWIAKCRMRQNDFAAAATILENAATQFPSSALQPEMTYDRAVSLMRAGDPAAAQALAGFRKSHPNHALTPDAIYLQASIEHARQEYAKSAAFCREFAAKYNEHALIGAVRFLSAENELLAGQFEKAVEGYRAFLAAHASDANAGVAKFRLGGALHRLNEIEEAKAVLSEVVQGRKTAEPNRRALWILGDIAFQQEQWNETISHMTDYLSFGPDQPSADDALLKTGLAQLRLNHADEAMKAFDRVTREFPQSVHRTQALFETGQILLAKKEHDRAAEAFQKVLDEAKDTRFAPFALNHLASIALHKQQFERAAELYAQVAQNPAASDLAPEASVQRAQALMAAKQFAAAAEAFAEFVKKYAKHDRVPAALAQRAIALARTGNHADVLKVIAAIEKDHASKLDPSTLATLKYEKAWSLRETDRNEDALNAYRELLASFPDQAIASNAALELAELEMAGKRHAEAEVLLADLYQRLKDGAISASDLNEPALYRLAACKYELSKFEEAARYFEEFLAAHPRAALLASALALCGESHYKSNNFGKAAPQFAALIEKYPADPACDTGALRLGECYAVTEQWPQSEKAFASFLKKFPDHELSFQAQFGVAWALENQSQYDKAITAYRALIDRHTGPTAARAQFQIGECLFAKKQYDDAVRELLKVDILYTYPEWSAAALFEAGRCFEELAKPVEARTQFEQVQQKYPQSRWAEMAAQRLNALASGASSGG